MRNVEQNIYPFVEERLPTDRARQHNHAPRGALPGEPDGLVFLKALMITELCLDTQQLSET